MKTLEKILMTGTILALVAGCGSKDTVGDPDTTEDVVPDTADDTPDDTVEDTTTDEMDVVDEEVVDPGPPILLGEGGFFGVSGQILTGGFAVGAHYADITGGLGDPVPAGRVYLFDNGAFPETLGDAVQVLQPPDSAPGGGFGWAIGNPCDFDGDGEEDLAVGNHLYSAPAAANSGRVVVFWGDGAGFSTVDTSYHHLSDDIRASSDSFGQSVLCADVDGDDFDDLIVGGQNAGPDDTGIAAIFNGSAAGLPETQDTALYPVHAVNQQYLGAASLWKDVDGDGAEDLVVGGWGLVKGDEPIGPHTGGLLVFAGGDDWSTGPSYGVFPAWDGPFQVGSTAIAFDTTAATFVATSATDYGSPITGAVLVWLAGFDGFQDEAVQHVLLPPDGAEDTGFGNAIDFVPDYFGEDSGALLVGMKYGDASAILTGTGAVAVFAVSADGLSIEETPTVLTAPDPLSNDAFGGAIVALEDVDGDTVRDFFVGMEGHIEGDIYTGTQTGGVVFY